jgi:hypothetical protein
MEREKKYMIASDLKDRGWTDGLIRRFLGEPDQLAANPHYRSAAPMRLYAIERITGIEATPAFAEAREKAKVRSSAALRAADRRRAALVERAGAMQVRVQVVEPGELLRRAIRHYNKRHNEWLASREYRYGRDDGWQPASTQSDSLFLERIQANYVRHQLTRYDRALDELACQVGVAEAGAVIRWRVYEEIASVYPHLAAECRRQHRDRQDWST